MTEIPTGLMRFGDLLRHLVAVESVKTVALNNDCFKVLARQDMLNSRLHSACAGT